MLPLHSCWLALLLLSQEVCCPRRLVDSASLVDWRCSYLCSESIPSVTEKSVIFIEELSFPQTAPTDDVFFNRNWAGVCLGSLGWTRIDAGQVHRLCVDGPGYDCCRVDRRALKVDLPCKKNQQEGGSARASPVAAPMPKSVSFLEKRETAQIAKYWSKYLRIRIGVPFTGGVDMYL